MPAALLQTGCLMYTQGLEVNYTTRTRLGR